jgi:hypothetical protein
VQARAQAARAAEEAERVAAARRAARDAAARKQARAEAAAAAVVAAAAEAPARQRREVRAPIQFWTAEGVTEGAARTKTSVKSVRQHAPDNAGAADPGNHSGQSEDEVVTAAQGRADLGGEDAAEQDEVLVDDSEDGGSETSDDDDDGDSNDEDEEHVWGSGRNAKAQKRGPRRHQLD